MIKQLTRFLMAPVAAALLLSACASQKGASAPTASGMRKNATGKWTLNDVSYEGLPSTAKIKTVFSDIPPDCLVGSNWVLPSNSYGSYTLTSTGTTCPTGMQNIVWSTLNQDGVIMLQFKELMDGVKAKNITDGYRVELQSADNASMVWRAPVTYEGKTAYVVYSFSRQ